MEKILTIVIPTYNMEEYIDKCLSSLVLHTGLEELEVIVVNDGSKDASLQIAQKYEKMFPQTFVVIDKDNGNYGSCINRGLDLARGKFFKILDADDSFDTESLGSFIEFLKGTDADLIMSDILIINQIQGLQQKVEYELPVGLSFTFDYFVNKNVPYMWMHAVTHLTEKMRRIRYHQREGISYTDKEFVYYPVAVSERVAYFPNVLYRYLIGRKGQTVDENIWVKNYWMEIEAIKTLLLQYKNHKDEVSDSARRFMELQGQLYIKSIYNVFLKKSRGALSIQELVNFDAWLEALDDKLYHCVDDEIETAQFHYIQEWRHYGNRMRAYLIHRYLHRVSFYLRTWHH